MSEYIEVDYPYIRAWSFVHRGNAITASVTLEMAREDGAPVDSVFQEFPSGRWVRVGDVADAACVAAVREQAASYRRFKSGHEPDAT